ncbi:hypothetical protein VTN96DRAFT_9641 [Rasamsonia emersonii]
MLTVFSICDDVKLGECTEATTHQHSSNYQTFTFLARTRIHRSAAHRPHYKCLAVPEDGGRIHLVKRLIKKPICLGTKIVCVTLCPFPSQSQELEPSSKKPQFKDVLQVSLFASCNGNETLAIRITFPHGNLRSQFQQTPKAIEDLPGLFL